MAIGNRGEMHLIFFSLLKIHLPRLKLIHWVGSHTPLDGDDFDEDR